MFSSWSTCRVASAQRCWAGRFLAGRLLEDSRSRFREAELWFLSRWLYGAWKEWSSRTTSHRHRCVCVMVWRRRLGCVRRGREWSGLGEVIRVGVLTRGTHMAGWVVSGHTPRGWVRWNICRSYFITLTSFLMCHWLSLGLLSFPKRLQVPISVRHFVSKRTQSQ